MDASDQWQLVLDAALTGACALVVSQLILTGFSKPWRAPLLLVFVGALWAGVAGLLLALAVPTAFALTGVASVFLAIAALWIYTDMITAEDDIKPITRYAKHFIPIPLALLALIPVAHLPSAETADLFRTGDLDTREKFHAALPWLFSQFVWVVWTPPYLVSIWNRLSRYRIALRDIHSSTERRELIWISALVGVLCLFWFANVLDLIDLFGVNSSLPNSIVNIIESLVIWIPALWGLRQIPGMQETSHAKPGLPLLHTETIEIANEKQHSPADSIQHKNPSLKYERSALDEDRANRIIAKLESSMSEKRLFQDANLSLGMLASDIGVSKHYLSQSINENLGVSFFEYINRHRTRQAAILLKTTTMPATEIAMQSGFNSRSSFYKAFKKHYNASPANYRKNHRD